MSAVETGQWSTVEARQMSSVGIVMGQGTAKTSQVDDSNPLGLRNLYISCMWVYFISRKPYMYMNIVRDIQTYKR